MEDETFFEELHKKYPQLLDSAAAAEGVRYRLEGYLFPATYDYYQGTGFKDLLLLLWWIKLICDEPLLPNNHR